MRRKLLVLLLVLAPCILTGSLLSHAQQPAKIPRIGYLSLAPGPSPRSEALRQALHELGYVQ